VNGQHPYSESARPWTHADARWWLCVDLRSAFSGGNPFATLDWVAWFNGSRLLEPLGYWHADESRSVLPSERVAARKRLRRIDAEPPSGVGMSPRPGGFRVGMLSVHRSNEAGVLHVTSSPENRGGSLAWARIQPTLGHFDRGAFLDFRWRHSSRHRDRRRSATQHRLLRGRAWACGSSSAR